MNKPTLFITGVLLGVAAWAAAFLVAADAETFGGDAGFFAAQAVLVAAALWVGYRIGAAGALVLLFGAYLGLNIEPYVALLRESQTTLRTLLDLADNATLLVFPALAAWFGRATDRAATRRPTLGWLVGGTALALAGWYAWTPDWIRVRIDATAQGATGFLVQPRWSIGNLHGTSIYRLRTQVIDPDRTARLPTKLSIFSRFGRVSVDVLHPEFQETLLGRPNYRGQTLELQPQAWQQVLDKHPEVETTAPTLDPRTHDHAAYLNLVQQGYIIRLGSVHYHLWSIKTYYLPAVTAADRRRFAPSLALLRRLANYVLERVSPAALTERQRRQYREITEMLAEITEAVGEQGERNDGHN